MIARREVRVAATSGVTWAVAVAFLALSGLLFWVNARSFTVLSRQLAADPLALEGLNATRAVIQPAVANLGLVAALVLPFFTLRLLAEDRRSGALDVLRALPFSDGAVVAGKYAAGLAVVTLLLGAGLVQPLALWLAGPIDPGHVAAGWLGVFLLASAIVALGLFTGVLTGNPAAAASATLALSVALVVVDQVAGPAPTGPLATLAEVSPFARLDHFSRGLVRLEDVAYFLLIDVVLVVAAGSAMRVGRRWG